VRASRLLHAVSVLILALPFGEFNGLLALKCSVGYAN
jgi:hypothetical protein